MDALTQMQENMKQQNGESSNSSLGSQVRPRIFTAQEIQTNPSLKTGTLLQERRSDAVCPVCQGTGYIYYEDAKGYLFSRECDACGVVARRREESRIQFANIPEAYKSIKLKDTSLAVYEQPESKKLFVNALKAIEYWVQHFSEMHERGMGLYFHSQTKGSGKTMTAAALANEIIATMKRPVKFATSSQILSEIKATWDRGSEYATESKLIDALCNTEILVIDDFGTEQVRDWINDKFYQIINGRYEDKKVTIYTSNFDLHKLKYDERITNRMLERSYIIPFPEESVRLRIAKENRDAMQSIINGD